ncbi:MAG: amidohydrolase family protein, partial [Sinomicrobium sp.]|nr:amidohydrolase family protein [Sinomicrobium sp.]
MNTLLKSATIIDPESTFHRQVSDILIADGRIAKIAQTIEAGDNFNTVTLNNLHVSRGWWDSSVCFGEPGFEERETLENGLATAAKSGFTDVAVQPDTHPVSDSRPDIAFLRSKAAGNAVNLYPVGALTLQSKGEHLAELYDMQNGGAVAFGDYKKPVTNPGILKIALQYAQGFDGLVCSFPQENNIAGSGVVNEHIAATQLGLKGIPTLAEALQVARDLFILEYTEGKLHIPTISTAAAVELIGNARKKGLNVSCSVAIHNLLFTDAVLREFDTNFKVLPPLRTEADRYALIDGLNQGIIDFATTDHCPVNIEHKKTVFDHALYGTTGLESAFGALHNLFGTEKTVELLTR